VVAAEFAALQLRRLQLPDTLELTALMALRDRDRGKRAGARLLQRWLDETRGVTIDDCRMVARCLAALGGPGHAPALETP